MWVLPILGASILATLATLHFIYALHDLVFAPRYFKPRDVSLLEPMRATHNALAPKGRDYWSALLGFHFSHSIGVLLFALLIVLASTLQIDWLKILLVCVGFLYTWTAWRCWFNIPLIGCGLTTGLMITGWAIR